MKKVGFLIISLFLCFSSSSQGIQFQSDTSWKEALLEAGRTGKLIFADVYTDWCGPCKRMNKEVFTLKTVGEKFNAYFINYKLNAEKGRGPALSRKYHVNSYPTYLFINSDGALIYKTRGAMRPGQLLKEASNALKEAKDSITIVQMEEKYPAHREDKNFMYAYLQRRTRLCLENTALLDDYFNLLNKKEQNELKNLQLVVDNGSFLNKSLKAGPAFYALLRNKDQFQQLRTDKYNNTLDIIINTAKKKTLSEAINKKDKKLLKEVLKLNRNKDIFNSDEVIKLHYLKGTKEYGQYLYHAIQYVNKHLLTLSDIELDKIDKKTYDKIIPQINRSLAKRTGMTEKEKAMERDSYKRTQTLQVTNKLNEICQNILSMTHSINALETALPWIRRCIHLVQRDPLYFQYVYPIYLDTYAHYLYLLDKKKEAISNEQRAVTLLKNATGSNLKEEYFLRLTKMKKGEVLNENE